MKMGTIVSRSEIKLTRLVCSVAEWLGCLTFFRSQTPYLKVSGSIPHVTTSANLYFQHCI